MIQIPLSDFPETIQNLVNQAQMTGDNLTITKEGKPLAVIQPITEKKRATFGAMKHRGKILGDIIEPTSNLVIWDV
ncbi:MAG: type II toxin-antitoxin system prevent-host-death family antitoxin [Gomphosphaeria aponina SAG 52.96 = DSM 107014]|uniref:Type II toxin-antitoxin system prevent-host-death family antitoxin n=1 Tax=Gomphosphaeria aponina SAG 52.96 = DSM 107014 TaxID=1521640 RepID=A0A941JVP5_9CHRO|nr:type II toxin-antitoxin system prevent-host-death family antitoxin [Gomphosphaeria aponina SAG 52.96 = DSM 107014]